MEEVITIATVLAFAGVIWGRVEPLGLDGETLRRSLTSFVYALLLPALVLDVLWQSPLSLATLKVILLAASAVFSGGALAWIWFRFGPRVWRVAPAALGAVVLASAFPNATYLGLPVLESVLGSEARAIAIQYDLMACSPILLTLGVMFAAHCGGVKAEEAVWRQLLRVPPLWAMAIALLLNLTGVEQPPAVGRLLEMLAVAVIPLMLFSLGLSLRWQKGWGGEVRIIMPVVVIQLLLTPLLVYLLGSWLALSPFYFTAVVLEGAMPSMVLGLVIADRYRLDSHLYAMAVTLTMVLSLFTLPFWLAVVSAAVGG
ncbi:MAG: AEC family transporter [Gammaproteobacteria bacterium]|nr:AEC family transporter [Gammaproteobacteria bacterium]